MHRFTIAPERLQGDRRARRREPEQVPGMGAVQRPVRDHRVPLGDRLVDESLTAYKEGIGFPVRRFPALVRLLPGLAPLLRGLRPHTAYRLTGRP